MYLISFHISTAHTSGGNIKIRTFDNSEHYLNIIVDMYRLDLHPFLQRATAISTLPLISCQRSSRVGMFLSQSVLFKQLPSFWAKRNFLEAHWPKSKKMVAQQPNSDPPTHTNLKRRSSWASHLSSACVTLRRSCLKDEAIVHVNRDIHNS